MKADLRISIKDYRRSFFMASAIAQCQRIPTQTSRRGSVLISNSSERGCPSRSGFAKVWYVKSLAFGFEFRVLRVRTPALR